MSDVTSGDDLPAEREHRIVSLLDTLSRLRLLPGGLVLSDSDWTQSGAYDDAVDELGRIHSATSDQVRKIREVALLAQDWMGSVSSRRRSFEEFLADQADRVRDVRWSRSSVPWAFSGAVRPCGCR